MSKIQLVIEIDEELYTEYVNIQLGRGNGKGIVSKLLRAIKDGKPLPKGHGALKDVDIIHKEIERLQSGKAKNGKSVNISRDQYKGMCYARGIINEAQTIIEANKEVTHD